MRLKWTRIALLLPLLFLWVAAQDANWGKKVNCYIVDGMTVCPGCNSRGGLTCPRVIPDEKKCDPSSSTTQATIPDIIQEEKVPTETSVIQTKVTDSTEPTKTTLWNEIKKTAIDEDKSSETTIDQDETSPKPTPNALDMYIYLHQLLQKYNTLRKPYYELPRRLKREADTVDDTCRWNGDCPCPLICCQNGEGRPSVCKMGIRLPPPWG